jgi:hypothetical protein
MQNSLTLRTSYSRPVSRRSASVAARRSPPTEGFGLVRRSATPSVASTVADDLGPAPAPRPDRDDNDLQSPMSRAQVAALHALVHARPVAPDARWARRDRGIDVVWAGTLAVLLALAFVSLDSGKTFVATADHLHAVAAARASAVAARATRQPVARQPVTQQAVARQSSAATSRTM